MYSIPDTLLDSLLARLSSREQFVLLDTSRPTVEEHYSYLFENPVVWLQLKGGDDSSKFLQDMQKWQEKGYWLAGWMGYEFGCLLEGRLKSCLNRTGDQGKMLAEFGVFSSRSWFDHLTGKHNFTVDQTTHSVQNEYNLSSIRLSQRQQDYLQAIRKIKEYIAAGDTYQVNYTLKLFFEFSGSVAAFYRAIRRNQSVSYGAFVNNGLTQILSFSPELFFRRQDNSITVRPMKGTWEKGRYGKEEDEFINLLQNDQKNRSENVMIVDLLRNDLAHFVFPFTGGRVSTTSLFDVESYETLLQMTSTITAEADEKKGDRLPLSHLFSTLFPCGSVTGAPKIRTMEIIDELETERRGVYTGAIGYISPSSDAVFNVPIRTVVLAGEHGEMGIGSGVVADSSPEQEWQECLLKGKFLTDPVPEFQLIETLLWQPDKGYWLLAEHLERLKESARYFLFACEQERVQVLLEAEAYSFSQQCMRVRITLAKDGTLHCTATPCHPPALLSLPDIPAINQKDLNDQAKIVFSKTRVNNTVPFFYHKTTQRQLFDQEFKQACSAGLADICFQNEQGEVTEGCISTLIILLDGKYITPHHSSGLLPGVMRGHLLSENRPLMTERVLYLQDLEDAEAIFLCNSVRGITQVVLASWG